MEEKQWKYKIGAGKMPVILSLGMTILFGSLSMWLHKTDNGAYFFGDILTGIMVAVLITTIYRLVFYKVLIGKDGFYYQTNPFNGTYFNYQDITRSWGSKEFTVTDEVQPEIITSICTLLTVTVKPGASCTKTTSTAMRSTFWRKESTENEARENRVYGPFPRRKEASAFP